MTTTPIKRRQVRPRNRSIRHDIWGDEAFVLLSPYARLLYIGMKNFADDAGIMPASPLMAKLRVFPGDSLTTEEIAGFVREIMDQGLVEEYQADDEQWYWIVQGWSDEQSPEKPNFAYPSPTNRRPIADQSPTNRRQLGHSNGNSKEIVKGEGEGEEDAPAPVGDEISKKNENTVSDFDRTLPEIQTWAKAHTETVQSWIAQMRYDVEAHGPAWHQIPRFVTYYLDPKRSDDKKALVANPTKFFEDRFPNWLGRADDFPQRKKGAVANKPANQSAYESPPAPRTAKAVGMTFATAWLSKNYPGLVLSKAQLHYLSMCENEAQMISEMKNRQPQEPVPKDEMKATVFAIGDTARAVLQGVVAAAGT